MHFLNMARRAVSLREKLEVYFSHYWDCNYNDEAIFMHCCTLFN